MTLQSKNRLKRKSTTRLNPKFDRKSYKQSNNLVPAEPVCKLIAQRCPFEPQVKQCDQTCLCTDLPDLNTGPDCPFAIKSQKEFQNQQRSVSKLNFECPQFHLADHLLAKKQSSLNLNRQSKSVCSLMVSQDQYQLPNEVNYQNKTASSDYLINSLMIYPSVQLLKTKSENEKNKLNSPLISQQYTSPQSIAFLHLSKCLFCSVKDSEDVEASILQTLPTFHVPDCALFIPPCPVHFKENNEPICPIYPRSCPLTSANEKCPFPIPEIKQKLERSITMENELEQIKKSTDTMSKISEDKNEKNNMDFGFNANKDFYRFCKRKPNEPSTKYYVEISKECPGTEIDVQEVTDDKIDALKDTSKAVNMDKNEKFIENTYQSLNSISPNKNI